MKKIVSNGLYSLIFISLLIMIISVISSKASGGEPQLFGYQFKTVLSGSMEPTFKTGSLILVEKLKETKNLLKDDIITYKQDEKNVVTHRIVEVIKQEDKIMYRTKGDNNEDPDMNPVISENIVAKYTGITIPFVGYFLKYANTPIGTAILLILPGLLLLGYSALTIRGAIKEIEQKTKGFNRSDPNEEVVS
jgi:signal peptidase I